MDELADLRFACAQAARDLETARRALHDDQARINQLQLRLTFLEGFPSPSPQETAEAQTLRDAIEQRRLFEHSSQTALDTAQTAAVAADASYDAAAQAAPPLFDGANDLPLLLLPLRLETVFRAAGPTSELWIRAYPDDIHVDSHEPGLTEAEQVAGTAYWRAVWAAGFDEPRRTLAWRELVSAAGAQRAPWILDRLRPAGTPPATTTPPGEPGPDPGPFPVVETRAGAWTRPAHTSLLPAKLVFSGYRAGRLLWRVEGAAVPDVLAVGLAPPGTDAEAGAEHDLPFTAENRWLVDFDAAVVAGMAVRVPMGEPNLHHDLVTVAGVAAGPAGQDAQRARDLLTAHAHTDGLDVLPVRTPTNNTPETKAGWRSRSVPSGPDGVLAARDAAERALGLRSPGGLSADDPVEVAARRFVGRLLLLSQDWTLIGDRTDRLPDLEFVFAHLDAHVRARGPLPALRVGRQPYGVLPVTATSLWRGTDVDPRVVSAVKSVLDAFTRNVHRATSVGRAPDQDAVILDLLSRRPASTRVRVTQPDPVTEVRAQPPAQIGVLPPLSPFAVRGPEVPGDEITAAVEPTAELLALVAQRPLAGLSGVMAQVTAAIEAWDGQDPPPNSEFLGVGVQPFRDALEPLLASNSAGLLYPLGIRVMAGSLFLGWLGGLGSKVSTNPADVLAHFQRVFDAIKGLVDDTVALEEQATTDLPAVERGLVEALDLSSHRIDAWVTSLATARLRRTAVEHPEALRTGAYGWVADLAPQEPGLRTAGDGYVLAPSLHHATTAAVLRSGWLAHTDRRALAVNLTSARVRRATWLLDGARSGQQLEALLGYRFERGLHDAGLDVLVATFRDHYPLAPVVAPEASGADAARAAIAARTVIDGQALRRDRAAFDSDAPPVAAGHAELTVIRGLLAELDEVVDAAGDLLLAESVHHLVGGNPLRAGLSADAIGRGDAVPDDFEFVSTPRSGVAVGHAVGVLVPAQATAAHGWSDEAPLAHLEPSLERWCRARLGPAGGWAFTAAGAPGGSVSLKDLAASALEVVLEATPGLEAPLARRLGALLDGPEGAGRYADLVALAEGLRAVLAAGTPLLESHLDPQVPDGWADADLDELMKRASGWLAGLQAAAAALRGAPTEAALAGLARLGATAAAAAGSPEDLADRASRALAVIGDAKLPDAFPAPPVGDDRNATTTLAWVTVVTRVVRSVVGDALSLLPVLRLAPGSAAAATLKPANRPVGAGPDEAEDWIRELAALRPAVSALSDALLAAEALAGSDAALFVAGQAAAAPGRRWVAVASDPDGPPARASFVLACDDATPGPVVSGFVVDAWTEVIPRPGRASPGPAEEVAAVAFHAPRPDARPPQALLIAVPPDTQRGWRMEDVHGVLEDTFDLARVRGLDLVDLPELRGTFPPIGPLLPDLSFR